MAGFDALKPVAVNEKVAYEVPLVQHRRQKGADGLQTVGLNFHGPLMTTPYVVKRVCVFWLMTGDVLSQNEQDSRRVVPFAKIL